MSTESSTLVFYLPALEIVLAMASIGLSSYQFQSTDESISGLNWKTDICESDFYKYLLPFAVKYDGIDTVYTCGYSKANTGFRLAVACLTIVVIGIHIMLKPFADSPKTWKYIQYILLALWYACLVADSTSLGNSTLACEDLLESSTTVCKNDVFGISIAFDIICMLPFLLIFYFTKEKDRGPALNSQA